MTIDQAAVTGKTDSAETSCKLQQEHLDDLMKSGLTPETIEAMGIRSMTMAQLNSVMNQSGLCYAPDALDDGSEEEFEWEKSWDSGSAYAIPYFDDFHQVVMERYRVFHHPARSGDAKYLSRKGASWTLYKPPGLANVLALKHGYLIITEGEKKAAKMVQEGFPCVGIAGVHMWFNPEEREIERHNGLPVSYRTPLLKELEELVGNLKVIVIFDSDASPDTPQQRNPQHNRQIYRARGILKDALLWHCAHWARVMDLPIPKGTPDDMKMGLDDLLVHPDGKALLQGALQDALASDSMLMQPLLRFEYDRSASGRPLHYMIPNTPKHAKFRVHQIIKEEEHVDDHGSAEIVFKMIATTRVWLNRVVRSVDGDDKTLYELGYVPLDGRLPKYLSGGSELIRLNRQGDDPLADHGARVLSKERPAVEEFFNACQSYGVFSGQVKTVDGTRRRGWLDNVGKSGLPGYIMASRVIAFNPIAEKNSKKLKNCGMFRVFATNVPDIPILPVDFGGDAMLKESLVSKGSFIEWKNAIEKYVLNSPLPSIIMATGMAGLLRRWCPDSENFIFHVYGESSHGKSNAMIAAASSWGDPEKLMDNWRTTDNGLERRGVARNDMALFLDESGQAPSDDVLSNAVYALGNGGEKMRATREARDRVTSKFKLVVLSNGEKQLIRNAKFAGQEVRALEIRVDILGKFWNSISTGAEAEKFKAIVTRNYGWAVEPMIQGILEIVKDNPRKLAEMHGTYTNGLRAEMNASTPQHLGRRAKHYGLILLSLALFLHFVMEWDDDMIREYVAKLQDLIAKNLLRLDTDQFRSGEKAGILQHFMDQVAKNQNHLVSKDRGDAVHGDVYGEIDGTIAYLIPGPLSDMMKPYDNARLVQLAEQAGVLIYNHEKRNGNKKVSHRIGNLKPDCYVFDLEKIEKILADS
jgi:hypothetical protein